MGNEIVKAMPVAQQIAEMGRACSISADTMEGKKAVYAAIMNPSHKVGDFINKSIEIKDVLIEPITIENEGEEAIDAIRTVLIDKNGESYQSTARGIYNSVMGLCSIFGEPTWEPAIKVVVKQRAIGKGNMQFLDVQ